MEPSTRDLLLAQVDELTARQAELLSEVKRVTEQLHPERARSCRNAITTASVMVDEIRLRATPGRWRTPASRCEPVLFG